MPLEKAFFTSVKEWCEKCTSGAFFFYFFFLSYYLMPNSIDHIWSIKSGRTEPSKMFTTDLVLHDLEYEMLRFTSVQDRHGNAIHCYFSCPLEFIYKNNTIYHHIIIYIYIYSSSRQYISEKQSIHQRSGRTYKSNNLFINISNNLYINKKSK